MGGLGGKVRQPGGLDLEDVDDKLESHEGAGDGSESLGDAGYKLEFLEGTGGVGRAAGPGEGEQPALGYSWS